MKGEFRCKVTLGADEYIDTEAETYRRAEKDAENAVVDLVEEDVDTYIKDIVTSVHCWKI